MSRAIQKMLGQTMFLNQRPKALRYFKIDPALKIDEILLRSLNLCVQSISFTKIIKGY